MLRHLFLRPFYSLWLNIYMQMPLINVYSIADKVQKCLLSYIGMHVMNGGHCLHTQNSVETLQRLTQPDNPDQKCEGEDALAITSTLNGCIQQQLYQVCCISSSTPAVNRSMLPA